MQVRSKSDSLLQLVWFAHRHIIVEGFRVNYPNGNSKTQL